MNQKITLVLPVAAFGKPNKKFFYPDLERIKTFLLPSYEKFVTKETIEEFVIVAPERELFYIKKEIKDFLDSDLKITLLSEDEIIPDLKEYEGMGWHKQQIIKLSASSHIKTDFYLTLDSDMFFTRPVDIMEFVKESKFPVNFVDDHITSSWWVKTAEFMGFDLDFPKRPTFTPVFMKTEIVKKLLLKLQERTGKNNWDKDLLDRTLSGPAGEIYWTEYCLYWLFLINECGGLNEHYYYEKRYYVGPSVWHEESFLEFSEGNIKTLFDSEAYHFIGLIQSFIDVSKEEIEKKFEYFFKIIKD